jgi:hypothetical protein
MFQIKNQFIFAILCINNSSDSIFHTYKTSNITGEYIFHISLCPCLGNLHSSFILFCSTNDTILSSRHFEIILNYNGEYFKVLAQSDH